MGLFIKIVIINSIKAHLIFYGQILPSHTLIYSIFLDLEFVN